MLVLWIGNCKSILDRGVTSYLLRFKNITQGQLFGGWVVENRAGDRDHLGCSFYFLPSESCNYEFLA